MNAFPRSLRAASAAFALGLAAGVPAIAQTYTATPIALGSSDYTAYPQNFTGVLRSQIGFGSGAVVRHPRVVISCAHVVFSKGSVDPWTSNVRWYRAHATGQQAPANGGQLLRGYQYYTGYTSAAQSNQTSSQSFGQDFVVHYAFEDTANGGYAGYWDDGTSALKSDRAKLITGFPSGNYSATDPRKYLMHRTGPFARAYQSVYGDYVSVSEVSAGPGNSGGPVWVHSGNAYLFAGVHVSGIVRSTGGSTDMAGAYGVDSSSSALIDAAIRAAGGTTGGGTSAAPVITTQPGSRRVNVGDSATFTVAASGSGLSYRWLFNGSAISGATSATLTLAGVTLAQAGTYQAVVSNTAGEARSNNATLSVDLPAPVITTQPASASVAAGANVSFTVTATGQGTLTYQWSFTNSSTGATSVIPDATSATLSISQVQAAHAGSYSVTVRDGAGASTTSRPATLTVGGSSGGGGSTPAGSNNTFANAATITGSSAAVTGSNVGATKEAGEPAHPDSSGGASVWWAWTAPASGPVTISTAGSSFDTILAVYTGSAVNSLTRIASNDDTATSVSSLVSFTAVSGTTYRIMVDGYGGATGSISLSLALVGAGGGSGLTNDNFSSRTAFAAAGGTLSGTNAGATRETGEPSHAGMVPARSVWFTWTAGASGTTTIATAGSNFDTVLAVYTGSAIGSLTAVAANDDIDTGTTSRVTFSAVAGTAYQIAVDGYGGATGNISISLTAPVATGPVTSGVSNDAFARPTPIGAEGGTFNVSTVGATNEPGEPDHANNPGGASVWFTWTAPSSGSASINTAGSNFDTVLAVYAGNAISGLTVIAANDDTATSLTSAVTFAVQSGQTYRIAVDGYSGASGNLRLALAFTSSGSGGVPPPAQGPANDAFANRATIAAGGATVTGNNAGATRETGEPIHAGTTGERSVWWTWTPSSTGPCTISTSGSSFNTVLAVYAGSTLNALVPIAGNDDESPGTTTSIVRFTATAGFTYQIAVDGRGNETGSVRLIVTPNTGGSTAPSNDAFTARATIAAGGAVLEGGNTGATTESGEPSHAGFAATRSIWWTWTPSRSGNATVNTNGSSFDTLLAVYRGNAVNALTEVASNDDNGGDVTSSVSFPVTAGTSYHIAVDGFFGSTGTVRLAASLAATSEAPGVTQNTRLANVSVRSAAGSGADTLVVGFAVQGTSPKPILIRAIGPTLGGFGVPGAMPDPVLTIYRGPSPIEVNDNWGASTSVDDIATKAAFIGAFPLSRTSRDAAVLINLLPGAYTAQISAAPGTGNGVALLESYDIDFNADADATGRKIINVSSRAQVGTGTNVMIAGFYVLGPSPKRVLIRGIGPGLTAFGVPGALADPQVIVRSNATVVASNDNWSGADVAAAAAATGAFALANGSRDAALIANLNPGLYTVELSGVNATTGVGLIEVYEVP